MTIIIFASSYGSNVGINDDFPIFLLAGCCWVDFCGPTEMTTNLGPNPKKLWTLPSNSLHSDAFKPRLNTNNSNFVKVTLNPLPSTVYHLNDNRALSTAAVIWALYLLLLCLCCTSGRSLTPLGDGSYHRLGPQSLLQIEAAEPWRQQLLPLFEDKSKLELRPCVLEITTYENNSLFIKRLSGWWARCATGKWTCFYHPYTSSNVVKRWIHI